MRNYEFDDDYDVDVMTCPECCGPARLMGTLGDLDHYRCEGCGWTFSEPHDYDEGGSLLTDDGDLVELEDEDDG